MASRKPGDLVSAAWEHARPSASERGDGSFRHGAICYRTPVELLDTLAPLLAAAVARDEPVSAVLDAASWAGLQQRLGATTESIARSDHADVHGWSGQTWVDRLAEQLRERATGGRRLTVVGQHSAAFDGPTGAYWSEVDAALNVALDGLPITMLCLYPINDVRPAIATAVYWNHPELLSGPDVTPNPDFKPPAEVLALAPASPAPQLGPALDEVPFGPRTLRGIRETVVRHARGAGLDSERVNSLVLAISELVSNSIEHGAGHGSLRWWTHPRRVIAEVHDPGSLGEVLPGLRRPALTGERGRGVYLARRLCDVVHLWSGPDGTRVRVETGR